MWLNLMITIYQGYSLPLERRWNNRVELINEIFIFYITAHLVTFTDFVLEVETQYSTGWTMLSLIALSFIFNFSNVIFVVCKKFKLLYVKYKLRW